MEFLKYIAGGAALGVAESFPVSGTGHALLMGHIFGQGENFSAVFSFLHIGILISVLLAYYKIIFGLVRALFSVIKNIFTGDFSFKNLDRSQNMLVMLIIGLIPMLLIFVPVLGSGTNVLGIAHEFCDTDNIILSGISFLINGVLLKLGIDSLKSDKFKYTYKTADNEIKRWDGRTKITVMDAIWCGVFQFISMVFPGVSHIGAVFSIGLIRGINKKIALDYSFLMGIPSIIIMFVSEFLFATKFNGFSLFTPAGWLGVVFAAIFGLLFIKILNLMVIKNKVTIFSVYTIVLGIIVIAVGIFEQVHGTNIFQGTVL